MGKRKIVLIMICFCIFVASILLYRQFFKSSGKSNADIPTVVSEKTDDLKDTEEKKHRRNDRAGRTRKNNSVRRIR